MRKICFVKVTCWLCLILFWACLGLLITSCRSTEALPSISAEQAPKKADPEKDKEPEQPPVAKKCKNCTLVYAPTANTATNGGSVHSAPTTSAETGTKATVKDKSKEKPKEVTKTITKTVTSPPWWMWPVLIGLAVLNLLQATWRFWPDSLK